VSAGVVYDEPVAGECDPSYAEPCILPEAPDLDCDDVYGLGLGSITVYPPDPHGFDGNGDGIGCEGRSRETGDERRVAVCPGSVSVGLGRRLRFHARRTWFGVSSLPAPV
jgi:hypothetical protein